MAQYSQFVLKVP